MAGIVGKSRENPDIGGVGVIPLRVVENVNAAAA